jgi:hypothetical protein
MDRRALTGAIHTAGRGCDDDMYPEVNIGLTGEGAQKIICI